MYDARKKNKKNDNPTSAARNKKKAVNIERKRIENP